MTLEQRIGDAKRFYLAKYGVLDWHFQDEGLIYAIQDYFSSMGEFSNADREYAKQEDISDLLVFIEEDCL